MGYLLDTDLARARESLAHIQRASEADLLWQAFSGA
jgi:hypothetical protein